MKVLIWAILFAGCSSMSNADNPDKLSNTVWVSKVAPDCVDTLKFLKDGKMTSYSCEIQYQSKGSYTTKSDTVVAVVNEDSHGTVEYWRYTYVMKNGTLLPILSEQKTGERWESEKSTSSLVTFSKSNNSLTN